MGSRVVVNVVCHCVSTVSVLVCAFWPGHQIPRGNVVVRCGATGARGQLFLSRPTVFVVQASCESSFFFNLSHVLQPRGANRVSERNCEACQGNGHQSFAGLSSIL